MEKTETGFGYVIQAYKMGGLYMHVITILAIIMLGVAIWKVNTLVKKDTVDLKWLDLIRMAGSVALAVGFFSQIVGIVKALEAIRAAADISPQIVMKGAIVSFYAPIWGCFVFIISMLFYYMLKALIKSRIAK